MHSGFGSVPLRQNVTVPEVPVPVPVPQHKFKPSLFTQQCQIQSIHIGMYCQSFISNN
jgi:hypothetical protein